MSPRAAAPLRSALAVLAALAALAAPQSAAAPGASPAPAQRFGKVRLKPSRLQVPVRQPGQGLVTSVTAQRAYLDRGAEDGLAVGAKLQLHRGGRTGATCEVESVGPHVATCRPGAIKVGDRFTLERRAGPAVPQAPPPPAAPDELAPRLAKLLEAELPLHAFQGGAGQAAAGVRAELGLFHTSIAAFTSPDTAFHQERADVAVYGSQLFGGLSFGADASAIVWSRRPAGFRSPHAAAAQLQVRELWAAWQFKNGFKAALGRLNPARAPGAGVVDGAQLSWTAASGVFGVGAYGGALPSPLTLTPLGGPYTAGLFAVGRLGGETVKAAAFEPSLRLAWLGRAGSNRFETQALLRLWWGSAFDARLEAAAGFGDGSSPAQLDAVRLDVGTRVAQVVRLRAAARYSGGGDRWLGAAPIYPSQAVHADAAAAVELPAGFVLHAQGGALYDFTAQRLQGRLGPELELPPFLGGALAFALGYDEELGWLPGRTGYLQVAVRPLPKVGVWARAAVFQRARREDVDGQAGVEGALSLSVDARVWRWLWVRGSGFARVGLGEPSPVALSGQLGLGATF